MTAPARTVDYGGTGNARQGLDVFAPDPERDLRTAVVVLHGGAFRHGDRSAIHARCVCLADQGITAIAAGYRLADAAAWPAQLEDATSAVAWVVEHAAELAVAPDRVVVQGHSAGGLLALLVAAGEVAGRRLAAAAAYYSPAELSFAPRTGDLPASLLLGPDATPDVVTEASPLTHIDEHFPPTVLVHGAGDRFLAPASSLRLFDALTAAGVPAELHLVAGQDHEFDFTPRYADAAARAVADFVRAQVAERDDAAREVVDSNPFVSMPPPGPPAGPH